MDNNGAAWYFYAVFVPAFLVCMFSYYASAHSKPVLAKPTLVKPILAKPILAAQTGASAPPAAMAAPANGCIPFSRLRANLAGDDFERALKALHRALSENGDGTTLVWEHRAHFLRGLITPTASFRGPKGRICRHVVYTLKLGRHSRSVEGIACRTRNLQWVVTS